MFARRFTQLQFGLLPYGLPIALEAVIRNRASLDLGVPIVEQLAAARQT